MVFIFIPAVILSLTVLLPSAGITASAAATDMPYVYYQFTDDERLAYDNVREGVMNFEEIIQITPAISADSMRRIEGALLYYDPEVYNIKSITLSKNSKISQFKLEYRYTLKDFAAANKAVEKRAATILNRVDAQSNDYAKLKVIHDAIVNNAVVGGSSSNIYGALVGGSATSYGYAKAFSYLAGKAGIQSLVDISSKGTKTFARNKVYYNNKWFNIDCAADDAASRFTDNVTYSFFCVPDSYYNGYTPYKAYFTSPAATATNAEYYKAAKLVATNNTDARKMIVDQIVANNKSKKSTVTIAFATDKALSAFAENVAETAYMLDTLDVVSKYVDNKIITDAADFYINADTRTVTICIYYPNTKLTDYYSDVSAFTVAELEYYHAMGLDVTLPLFD
jgi:hypothetical protein